MYAIQPFPLSPLFSSFDKTIIEVSSSFEQSMKDDAQAKAHSILQGGNGA